MNVLINEPVAITLEVNEFNELVVVLTDELNVLIDELKVFKLAVVVLIELLNALNEDVVTNEDVSTFNTEDVVAKPKLVIC